MKIFRLVYSIVLVSMIISCTSPDGPHGCTSEFVMFSVTVLNPDGQPADSVNIKVQSKESGNIFECGEYLCNELNQGNYTIMHDGLREKINSQGETVTVEGTKDNLKFSEEFLFKNGRCHVEKVTGPDTVSLISN